MLNKFNIYKIKETESNPFIGDCAEVDVSRSTRIKDNGNNLILIRDLNIYVFGYKREYDYEHFYYCIARTGVVNAIVFRIESKYFERIVDESKTVPMAHDKIINMMDFLNEELDKEIPQLSFISLRDDMNGFPIRTPMYITNQEMDRIYNEDPFNYTEIETEEFLLEYLHFIADQKERLDTVIKVAGKIGRCGSCYKNFNKRQMITKDLKSCNKDFYLTMEEEPYYCCQQCLIDSPIARAKKREKEDAKFFLEEAELKKNLKLIKQKAEESKKESEEITEFWKKEGEAQSKIWARIREFM